MKAEFETVVGRQYLKAVHLNDSKGEWIVIICRKIDGVLSLVPCLLFVKTELLTLLEDNNFV